MPRKPYAKEMSAFESLVIINDFFDHTAPLLTGTELKLALVILRRTVGWYKLSDEIGVAQFCIVAKADKDTVKKYLHSMCAKAGILIEQNTENGVLMRRRFTWPINDRVEAVLMDVFNAHRAAAALHPEYSRMYPWRGRG